MKQILFAIILFTFLNACKGPQQTTHSPSNTNAGISVTGKLFASLFQQRAAEYHALCLQAYNLATEKLNEILKNSVSAKPMAVITDIDETILDNSAYDVHQSLLGKDYEPVSWAEWTAKAAADTVPGALTFFKYAATKGIRIYYVTNRDEKDRAGTLQNLIRLGFPDASNDHLLVKQNSSGKEARRQQVMSGHEVLLLFGDNLSDFSDLFDKKLYEDRLAATKRLSAEFGSRFIVLPNPAYGDWELSLYQFKSLSLSQKDSAARHWLKSY